jgi:hypothetical protein
VFAGTAGLPVGRAIAKAQAKAEALSSKLPASNAAHTGGKGTGTGKGKGKGKGRPASPDQREGSEDSAASEVSDASAGGVTKAGEGAFAGTVGLPVGQAIAKAQSKARALKGAQQLGPGTDDEVDFTL